MATHVVAGRPARGDGIFGGCGFFIRNDLIAVVEQAVVGWDTGESY